MTAESPAANADHLVEFKTRFLFPFGIPRGAVTRVKDALRTATLAGCSDAWEEPEAPDTYRDELLSHVSAYLFPGRDAAGGCGYLRLAERPANRVFRDLVVTLRRESVDLEVDLVRPATCEVFVTEHGVGMLSIALDLHGRDLTLDHATDFNYLGSGRYNGGGLTLEIRHPASDPRQWAAIPEAGRSRIPPAPHGTLLRYESGCRCAFCMPPHGTTWRRDVGCECKLCARAKSGPWRPNLDVPVAERLGMAGGHVRIQELAEALLAPLVDVGLEAMVGSSAVVTAGSVFTVARFDAEVDFDVPSWREKLGCTVAALAQVEEPLHAGAAGADLGVPNGILNRKHWAAASQLGSAHLVADQSGDGAAGSPEFNHERVFRVFNKYFVAYLAAYFQRLVLQQVLRETGEIIAGRPESDAVEALQRLRSGLMHFAVSGHFTQVSTRHAVHRYYQFARRGLDVEACWTEARTAIADLDAANATRQQLKLTRSMAASQQSSLRMQSALHQIEMFLFAVYSAHLTFMLLESMRPLAEESHAWKAALDYGAPVLVAFLAAVGFLFARAILHRKPVAELEAEDATIPGRPSA